jgi:hypothetical protein
MSTVDMDDYLVVAQYNKSMPDHRDHRRYFCRLASEVEDYAWETYLRREEREIIKAAQPYLERERLRRELREEVRQAPSRKGGRL